VIVIEIKSICEVTADETYCREERDEAKKQLSAVMEESHKHRYTTVICDLFPYYDTTLL